MSCCVQLALLAFLLAPLLTYPRAPQATPVPVPFVGPAATTTALAIKAPKGVAQSKRWVFTFNGDATACAAVRDAFANIPCEWAAMQLEQAPTTGQLHVQGAVILKRNYRLSSVSKLDTALKGAHWETMKGKAAQARDYVLKEESRVPELQGGWKLEKGALDWCARERL